MSLVNPLQFEAEFVFSLVDFIELLIQCGVLSLDVGELSLEGVSAENLDFVGFV